MLQNKILLLFLISISLQGYSQKIENPSFEGLPRANIPPFSWNPCNTFSTPDTQPGAWNVKKPASNRATYLGLVTRGDLGPYANSVEAVQTQLKEKLIAGNTYTISIDLAFSDMQGHDDDWGNFVSYANPVILKIWGGVTSCEKTELLWESPPIDHINWKTYELTLTPEFNNIQYLILEANYTALPSYFGNILIDNIIEKDILEPPFNGCNLETFNVFTPNGDGHNDLFLFKAVTNVARFNLKICNRWGLVLFETNDLTKGWDGKTQGSECSAGIYYWYTEFMCINGDQILDNKLKGTVTLLK